MIQTLTRTVSRNSTTQRDVTPSLREGTVLNVDGRSASRVSNAWPYGC